jgi:putative transposase
MNKAHSIKLNPTKKQRQLFAQACGISRHSYNWGLNQWNERYKNGEKPSAMTLIKLQNSIKKTETPFYLNVSKTAPQYALWDLENAFKKFFKKETAYPKFKKKGRCVDSFLAVENKEQFKQQDFKIHIPRVGKVKCFENLRFKGKVNSVTVKRVANDWFAVVQIDSTEIPLVCENQATIGIDVGIKDLIICSDGTKFENPKALRIGLKSLKRYQRSLSRKVKGSNNRKRQQRIIAKKHQRIANIRKNAIHQATTAIIKKGFGRIVIEDLNVEGMAKNRKLSQAISDASFGEIARQLAYKCFWNGIELVKADRFFASSKTCSCCGHKKEILKLSERIYNCENCGLEIDRDVNAAKNLANYSPTAKSAESKAFGESTESHKVQSASMKNEITKLSNNIVQKCTLS